MSANGASSGAGRVLGCAWIALAAMGASLFPDALRLDRGAAFSGELWRLWTGHLVHGSTDHFVYDAGAACLALLAFGRPRRWGLLLLSAAPIFSLVLLVTLPGLDFYYGLSGLLHAWFVAGTLCLYREERGSARVLPALLCIGGIAKAALETWSGTALFSHGLDLGGATVHASHLVGALLGLTVGLSHRVKPERRRAHSSGETRRPAQRRTSTE